MTNAKTNEYLTALRTNQTDGLQQIFFEFHAPVFRRILTIVQDEGIADDLAQEVFIRLWEKRNTLDIQSNFAAYLQKMAMNEALGYLRKQHNRIVPFHAQEDQRSVPAMGESLLIGEEMATKIEKALTSLPPRCREIFLMSREQGLTYQQIADQLTLSKKTVEHQMGKALQLLRQTLLSAVGMLFFSTFL